MGKAATIPHHPDRPAVRGDGPAAGLGITLALVSFELVAGVPWLGIATIALLVLLPHCPATLVALAVLMVLAQCSGAGAAWPAFAWGRA